MSWLERLFQGNLMPHGQCLLWRPDLLLMHIGGDILTVVAYFTIPIALILLVKKRDDLEFNWVFLMFSAFIFLCGLTHLIALINIWHGYYFIEGLAKVLTGIVSISTACMTLALLPKAISMPSRKSMLQMNRQLKTAKEDLLDLTEQLERKVTERTIALEKLAVTDELTDLLNRRAVMARLTGQLQLARRYGKPFSLMMCDLDYFKSINDTYGHPIGDEVLTVFADHLKQATREVDSVGRVGGEEFLILFPETPLAEAITVAERLCERCRDDRTVSAYDGTVITFSCSIGVVQCNADDSEKTLLNRVDVALYDAKASGRDTVASA
ncbi:GGDEF domain-containing protein [Reinekea blandensis]|uniref:diguanylate cyclase n=1 Tax=Reinekea blandensis MED297 TaxID=314283 RepID=A4B919_9GAMM|nr:GGDEF domain-containing protein [Reinekea blandensis]EAR11120.1 Bacteriophytochrome (light-regulated signal transduction histidine kinase) [Reinekea sp. MED297] [Reinekea blandensis MED297]